MNEKLCQFCGKTIPKKKGNRLGKFCCYTCWSLGLKKKREKYNPPIGVDCAKVGTIAELTVCCDLIKRGYEVFRSISPSKSCDLIILRNGELSRVEVTTGIVSPKGNIGHVQYDKSKSDILAVFLKDGRIGYKYESRILNDYV